VPEVCRDFEIGIISVRAHENPMGSCAVLMACIGCDMKVVSGNPNPKHVSTSFVERQNLSMRMSIRRFTRLTNAFSKKVENHAAAVALWFMYYNFCRIHQTLRVTPAMESGLTNHPWSIEELLSLLDSN
jgi:hypothetical protein